MDDNYPLPQWRRNCEYPGTYWNLTVYISLVSFCKNQVNKDFHILFSLECVPKLRRVPNHHTDVHYRGGVSLPLVLEQYPQLASAHPNVTYPQHWIVSRRARLSQSSLSVRAANLILPVAGLLDPEVAFLPTSLQWPGLSPHVDIARHMGPLPSEHSLRLVALQVGKWEIKQNHLAWPCSRHDCPLCDSAVVWSHLEAGWRWRSSGCTS